MAEPILQKSPSVEANKSELKLPESCLNGSQHRLPAITEPIHALDGLPPTIRAASVCYLPGSADHFVSILEETVSNLTLLHEYLSEIEKMLVKGGDR
jgi:hypothetical protein